MAHIDEKYDDWTGILRVAEIQRFKKTESTTEPCGKLCDDMFVFSNLGWYLLSRRF